MSRASRSTRRCGHIRRRPTRARPGRRAWRPPAATRPRSSRSSAARWATAAATGMPGTWAWRSSTRGWRRRGSCASPRPTTSGAASRSPRRRPTAMATARTSPA
jgi:hypothetical protein